MPPTANRRAIDQIDRRVGILFAAFLTLLVLAAGRAAYLGLFRSAALSAAANEQQVERVTIPAVRGTITDRSGVVLALSESADDVIADPMLITDPRQAAAQLAPLLGVGGHQVLAALTKSGTGYSPIADNVPTATGSRIMKLGINGISLNPVERRVYPRDTAAAQVLGWVGGNGAGGGGLEYEFNHQLAGVGGLRRVVTDPYGQALEVDNLRKMQTGKTLRLTISAPLQAEVDQVLAGVGAQYRPVGATAIVADPQNGQILALGSWPSMNSNDVGATPFDATEDQAIGMSYEPGSTFKAITVAGALQDGVVTPDTTFDVPPDLDPYGHVIQDAEAHGYETLSVADILKVSSNIGADLIAQREGQNNFASWVDRFGFGKPTRVALPGEQRGIVPPASQYSGLSIYNLPFGQGLEVTPMQMVQAYDAIADGGILRSPQIVESVGGGAVGRPAGKRIISSNVAAELRDMLRGVFGDGGTASGAQIPGYDLAGKTGTANIAVDGKYSSTEFVASFIGMVPASNPKLVVAVVVNQPQGAIYGGTVAAPAFQKIVSWAVPYLGINPCPAPCPASADNSVTASTP
jgi:cell division protein FtsI (penicillin-binding protein 3)